MNNKLAPLLLRSAIAFSFAYAAIASLLSPENWVGWFPPFTFALSPFTSNTTLAVFSIFELALAAVLLSGKWGMYAATVSGLMLLGITVFNLGAMDIVFRDISLALAAFALAMLYSSHESSSS